MNKFETTDSLVELVELALEDLRKVREDKHYIIDMAEWHCPTDDGLCSVCLAGSVMAMTYDLPYRELHTPGFFLEADGEIDRGRNISNRLAWLNDLRFGRLHRIAGRLGGRRDFIADDFFDANDDSHAAVVEPVPYDQEHPQLFESYITKVAKRAHDKGIRINADGNLYFS